MFEIEVFVKVDVIINWLMGNIVSLDGMIDIINVVCGNFFKDEGVVLLNICVMKMVMVSFFDKVWELFLFYELVI